MREIIDVGMIVNVVAGVNYNGKVTEIEEHGFWLTEDFKTEEFVSFADVEKVNSKQWLSDMQG